MDTLLEEKSADLKLSALAEAGINQQAFEDRPGSRPPRVRIPGVTYIEAVSPDFHLTFRFPAQARIEFNGQTYTPTDGTLDATITENGAYPWEIKVGDLTIVGTVIVTFNIPASAGIGAFVVPVIPVRIIYAPPQYTGAQSPSEVRYDEFSVHTRAFGFQQSSSNVEVTVTTPVQIGAVLAAAAPLAAKIPKVGPQVAGALTALSTAFGEMNTSRIDDFTRVRGRSMEIITSSSHGRSSAGPLIPGHGDIFEFVEDAKFVWVYDGRLHVAMVDFAPPRSVPADSVRQMLENEKRTGRNPAKVKALHELLQSDPFIAQGSWPTNLPSPRFTVVSEVVAAYGAIDEEVSSAWTEKNWREISRSQTLVEKYSSGWLEFLGVGETRNGESRITTVTDEFKTQATTTGQKAHVKLSLPTAYAPHVKIYFDDQNGTFLIPQKTYVRPPVGGAGGGASG